jgi:hypothetical protein
VKLNSKKWKPVQKCFLLLIKPCHKSTAANSKVYTKGVQNSACQNHCTSDIYATLIDVVCTTTRSCTHNLKHTHDPCIQFLYCFFGVSYITVLMWAQRNKLIGVSSCNHGGQEIVPSHPVQCWGNVAPRQQRTEQAQRVVAPSNWYTCVDVSIMTCPQ